MQQQENEQQESGKEEAVWGVCYNKQEVPLVRHPYRRPLNGVRQSSIGTWQGRADTNVPVAEACGRCEKKPRGWKEKREREMGSERWEEGPGLAIENSSNVI